MIQLLDRQDKARSVPAVELRRLLRTLEDKSQALQVTLRDLADLVKMEKGALPSENLLVLS